MVASHNQRALVLEARGQPLNLADVPIPDACPGSAIVGVLVTNIGPLTRRILTGQIPVPLEPPVVPCAQTIGRIHALGPDSTSLDVGQLVFVDLFTRSRDNPDDAILQGYVGGSAASMKLMDAWKDGTFAQYARMPLENIAPLNEELLGRYMFDRKHTLQLIKLLESGQLKLGSGDGSGVKVRTFKIEEVEEAMDAAERELRWGDQVVLDIGQ
ncbi:hypothetical protein AUP68_10863 [Ilyonectria robusta]